MIWKALETPKVCFSSFFFLSKPKLCEKEKMQHRLIDPPTHCYCGIETCIITPWTNVYPRRRFLRCDKHKVMCLIFESFKSIVLGFSFYRCLLYVFNFWCRNMEDVDSSFDMMLPCIIGQRKSFLDCWMGRERKRMKYLFIKK